MENERTRRPPLTLIFASGVTLTFGLTMAIFYRVMHPSIKDVALLAVFLSVTAAISVAAGYSAYRLEWMTRFPRLSWTLLAGYALSSALTLLNVGMTAWLMFVNRHDLLLATVLLDEPITVNFMAGLAAVFIGIWIAATEARAASPRRE